MYEKSLTIVDRRVQRTRHQLLRALIELMGEGRFDDLTVQDLLDRSGVGRATFYAHFRSKEDLFRASIQNMKQGVLKAWEADLEAGVGQRGEMAFALPFLKHVESHRFVWRSLVGGDGASIVDRQFRNMFAAMARHDLGTSREDPASEAKVQFAVGGLMALVHWWMDGEVSLSGEDVYLAFQSILSNGVKGQNP